MDIVYVAGLALLWGLVALLFRGLKKPDKPLGGRP